MQFESTAFLIANDSWSLIEIPYKTDKRLSLD